MTKEEQLEAVEPWCAAMRKRIADGVAKGRPGWRDAAFDKLAELFHDEYDKLLADPTYENAADVANVAFMIAEVLQREVTTLNAKLAK
jgi:hypothetical protein